MLRSVPRPPVPRNHETTKARHGGTVTGFVKEGWRRSTLPPTSVGSTIDAAGLNCRVRDGTGCDPCAHVASQYGRLLRNGDVATEVITPRGRDQASRAISTARLTRLRACTPAAYYLVVSQGPSGSLRSGSIHLEVGFPLRCVQRLSRPDIATRRCHWRDSRYTSGPSNPVLSY